MIGYKDVTFCSFYKKCKKGCDCLRALTPKIKKDAIKWWGDENAPISIYGVEPECFVKEE